MIAEGDPVGAAVLLAVLLGVMAVGEGWTRLGSPDPEQSRKFVHLGSAVACLLFPVLIESPIVVGAMAVGMSVFFAVASRFELLESLHAVERESRGSEYYAVAIFLVFLLAGDDLWVYFSSVLILGVADAFAALIGTRWGRLRYTVQDDEKSIEGSSAFFAIAFVAVLLPAPFFADLPVENLLHVAFAAAFLLTCFEAISMRGADNLFVPVAAAVILEKFSADTPAVLVFENLHLVGIFAAAYATNTAARLVAGTDEAPFNAGGITGFAMFTFASWALAGAPWAMPVAIGFFAAIAAWFASRKFTRIDVTMRIRPTYRALLLPFGVILFANIFDLYADLFGAYLAISSAVLAFAVTTLWRPSPEVRGPWYSTRFSIGVGAAAGAVIALPALALFPDSGPAAPAAIIATTALISAANYHLVERRPREGDEHYWPASQILLAVLAGVAIYLAHTGELLPAWQIPIDEELMRYRWQPWW